MDRNITLMNQNNLNITGIEKVKAVSATEIVGEMDNQTLIISGENMEVQTLDVENCCLTVNGKILGIKFSVKKPPLLKRLLK